MAQHLRIKICGITDAADGRQAALLGADAVGLNFYEGSPRHVEPAQVEAILRELPPFVEAVGVFVNEDLEKACERAFRFGRIGTLQMLADEDAKPQAAGNAFPFQLIAAFRVSDRSGLQEIDRYLELCGERSCLPAAVLVDAFVSGQYGGTGRTAPWDLLADFRIEVPLILAGGLTAGNVAEAVRIVRPYGIDVASGVELQPGRKDPDKMRRFIDNARSV